MESSRARACVALLSAVVRGNGGALPLPPPALAGCKSALILRGTTAGLQQRRVFSSQAGASVGSASPADVDLMLHSNGIAVLTLQRPSASNAFSRRFIGELREAIDLVRNDNNAQVMILRSSVEKVFCAGADLKERAKMSDREVSAFVDTLRQTIGEVYSLPQPSIAVLDGAAFGGGLELALACDFRVAGAGATLGLTETRLGIIPGAGGTQLMSRLIGAAKAKEFILTGRRFDGREAERLGVVNHFVDSPSAFERGIELANEILKSAPLAVRAAKAAINAGIEVDLATAMKIEGLCYSRVIGTSDRLEGLKAFQNKRKPQFRGE